MRNHNIIKAAFISKLMGDTRTDYQLQQAAQPSPRYLEAVKKKGLLDKYYNDKMTQDYAVNPSEGDKGVPAKALPVADQNSAPQYAAPAQPEYPTPVAPVKVAPNFDALFKKHHKTSFNPVSSMDKGKMEKLKAKYGY